MTADDVTRALTPHRHELVDRFRVAALALFGSVSRGEAGPRSDVDILVDFDGPPTFLGYMRLKARLEELLGCPVDLVTRRAIHPALRERIESEAVRVA